MPKTLLGLLPLREAAMGFPPKVVEQENAALPSSYTHIKITTKLLINQPGELRTSWTECL